MSYMLIRHEVQDFARWKSTYDDHRNTRQVAGLDEMHIFRDVGSPNQVTILFRVDDPQKARAFVSSVALREAMADAGVEGEPDIRYLNDA